MPIEIGNFRDEAITNGDLLRGKPYILSPTNISNPLLPEDYPLYMQAYIPLAHESALGLTALSHQNTRLIKICLERGGIAVLDRMTSGTISNTAKSGDTLNLISDGYGFKSEILTNRPKSSAWDDPLLR